MAQKIGLILDIVGALMLFISTEQLNGIIIKLLKMLHDGQGKLFSPDEKYWSFTRDLQTKKTVATIFSYAGLILLVLGFALQLYACY